MQAQLVWLAAQVLQPAGLEAQELSLVGLAREVQLAWER